MATISVEAQAFEQRKALANKAEAEVHERGYRIVEVHGLASHDIGQTVIRAHGVDIDTGENVIFAGDHRAMLALADHFEDTGGDYPLAEVYPYQVLRAS